MEVVPVTATLETHPSPPLDVLAQRFLSILLRIETHAAVVALPRTWRWGPGRRTWPACTASPRAASASSAASSWRTGCASPARSSTADHPVSPLDKMSTSGGAVHAGGLALVAAPAGPQP